MKDFFKEYWKIAAGCSAGAFLLSFFVGLIARNPFGVVLLRAFLLALLFAALGVGLRIVVRRYLPEVNVGEPVAAAAGKEARGARVDITLPEEDGISRKQGHAEARAGRAPRPTEGVEDAAVQAEALALGELAQDLGDEVGIDETNEGAEPAALGGDSMDESGTEYAEDGESAPPPSSLQGTEDDLDTLPEIARLEPDAAGGTDAAGSRPIRRVNGGERPEDAVRAALSGQDPATLARGIRTFMSKDEKG